MIINIVDRREREYRFKKVNAVIEPAWHDNECEDADEAEQTSDDWIGYDQREHVTVAEAVAWAIENKDAVTLYLYDEDSGIYEVKGG